MKWLFKRPNIKLNGWGQNSKCVRLREIALDRCDYQSFYMKTIMLWLHCEVMFGSHLRSRCAKIENLIKEFLVIVKLFDSEVTVLSHSFVHVHSTAAAYVLSQLETVSTVYNEWSFMRQYVSALILLHLFSAYFSAYIRHVPKSIQCLPSPFLCIEWNALLKLIQMLFYT